MSRRLILSLLCVSAVVVFVQLSSANSRLTVNEATSKFLIQDQPIVVLDVVNPAPQILPVRLYLDLIDPADNSHGRAVRDVMLQPGSNRLSTPITLRTKSLSEDRDVNLPWYRLRYRIEASSNVPSPPESAAGIISISQMDTPDLFTLEVSTPRATHPGANQYVHVRAFHPVTRKPVKDVGVTAELKVDGEVKPLTSSAITDAGGHALLTFTIPPKLAGDEGEIKVSGRHGGFVCETSDDIELRDEASVVVTTDKPIYQPGQPLHVRALVFNSNKRAAANAAATLKILDPEGSTVFETELVSSRFGVVTGDWTIPENTRFGHYTITVELDDEIYSNSSGSQLVKISRYDLPNFTVTAKADRSYYLPHENAEVEVHADYLFGQPVQRGHVRVVREEERRWDYEAQKWDTTEQEKYEGDTDARGVFKVHLDLSQFHEDLQSEEYLRFKDVTYAAYFTDPTTNRTEERRFDLRITRDAIHIYVAGDSDRQARGFPMEFFVATSFADGTPAPADVAISEVIDGDANKTGPVIKTLHTNKYGIAKVTGLLLPNANTTEPSAKFVARAGGKTGQHTESFYYTDTPVLRIKTDKIFYRPGDTIKVDIASSQPQMNLFVDVATDANIIESRSISTVNGAATFDLRYRPEFRDELTIAAYAKSPLSRPYDFSFGLRTVLFPRDRDLKLNFTLDRADYKPGEDASVDFRVLTPDGRPATSALGVVVFDRAVEERARSDQDFGGTFGFYGSFSRWRGYEDQVGGITRKDLQRVDLSKPLPEGIESVAELLLGSSRVTPAFFNSTEFASDHSQVFAAPIALQLKPVTEILEGQYKDNGVYPENGETLRRLLFESGVKFTEVLDPWGTPYRDQFSIQRDQLVLEVTSAGPDKTFGTPDDFSVSRMTRAYFRFNAEAIKRAVERFHARTGRFIRDAVTLKDELRLEGIDFDALRDHWGQRYGLNFSTNRTRFYVTVRSGGPNQRLEPENLATDDFTLSTTGIDYLTETRGRVTGALAEYSTNTNALPHDEAQLQRALSSLDQDTLIDPWGNHFYSVFDTSARFADRVIEQTTAKYGQAMKAHTEIIPVTQQITTIKLRSSGADRMKGTADDFDVVEFSQLTSEQARHDQKPEQPAQLIFFSGAKGAIKGTVIDPMGAVIPSAKITATNMTTQQEFSAETDDSGQYLLRNVPVGLYSLRCDAVAFKAAVITEIRVASSNITTVDITLEVGTVSEVVAVMGDSKGVINTTNSSTASAVTSDGPKRVSIGTAVQLSTPRLREYFPETLVWSPALETDKQGRAKLKFKLADNITTWKMSVLGSTEGGEMGTAEAEIKAFQPFFVEHDPPRVLTEGDRIALPVVLRNYLERAQTVDLEITPEKWFTLQGPARQQANVGAGDAAREIFDLTAIASIKDGKQRITARSAEAGDAIEKPVTVHPDGAERTQTASDLFNDAVTLNLELPESVIAGSTRAELKIYPNLMAHVIESVDGILERPHGCGEQTISSTYPSLLILRHDRQSGTSSKVHEKAKRYAELGYQRLLNYRSEDGGFTYWGRGEADLALTAYALRFLHDARDFVEVNEDVINGARAWLIKQQQADGSWPSHSYDENSTQRHTAMLSAFVARVLAMTATEVKVDDTANSRQAALKTISPELKRAFAYLAGRVEQIDEPYLIATYALAAMDAGEDAAATRAVAKLRALARTEGDTTYWALETNTPFYGWGFAGRVETTALAVQALARRSSAAADAPIVRRGLLFLLRAKDRYGVWYSTQATINVLDTLITLLPTNDPLGGANGSPVEIVVNGNRANALELARRDQTGGIFRDDISRFLHPGTNRIELRRASGNGFASVQAVANYYVPWTASESAASGALRLQAKFDRQTAQISEEIICHVKAERVGFSGYGMMLAEIGLPPGADVDRASLENAMKNSDWAFNQYDVLPDRVVVYLWPRAGGVAFDFKFRPRFGLTAKAAPSVIYDYYNPEARAVVAPVTFVVK